MREAYWYREEEKMWDRLRILVQERGVQGKNVLLEKKWGGVSSYKREKVRRRF